MLNLEGQYGTMESLGAVFARALQQNDPKTMFFHMVRAPARVVGVGPRVAARACARACVCVCVCVCVC